MSADDLDLAEMVAAIPNDFDWETWYSVGMAIFATSGGSEDGFIAFDDLSARSSKYQPLATAERWRNYRRSPPNRTGIGKLVALALAAGWRPSGAGRRRSDRAIGICPRTSGVGKGGVGKGRRARSEPAFATQRGRIIRPAAPFPTSPLRSNQTR
jgi:hypothetical protein